MRFMEKILNNLGRSWDKLAKDVPALGLTNGTGLHTMVTVDGTHVHFHSVPFRNDLPVKQSISLDSLTISDLSEAIVVLGYGATLADGINGSIQACCLMPVKDQPVASTLTVFTASLWRILYPIHKLLEQTDSDLDSAIEQMSLITSRYGWTDYWASIFGVNRKASEGDEELIRRLYIKVFNTKINNVGIKEALKYHTQTEVDVQDYDPARFIIIVDPMYMQNATNLHKIILGIKGAGIDYILQFRKTWEEHFRQSASDRHNLTPETLDQLTEFCVAMKEDYREPYSNMFTIGVDDIGGDTLLVAQSRRYDLLVSAVLSTFDTTEVTFTRTSPAWLNDVRYGREAVQNLLPAGSKDFVTGWTSGTGETCTVVDYPVNIPGIGDVVAKRITGNGLGASVVKRYCSLTGRPNPHTDTCSVWAMKLSGTAYLSLDGNSTGATAIDTVMQRHSNTKLQNDTDSAIAFLTATATDILDIVVYSPQVNSGSYAGDYTPPGTSLVAINNMPRFEADGLMVEEGTANLLTGNQASVEIDTVGFTSSGDYVVSGSTVSRDTSEYWQGNAALKVVTTNGSASQGFQTSVVSVGANNSYTASVYLKGSGTVRLILAARTLGGAFVATTISGDITLTTTWTRYSVVLAFDTTAEMACIAVRTAAAQVATIYADGLQLEQKPYATSWQLPGTARAAEALTVPGSKLSTSQGTIIMDFVAPVAGGQRSLLDATATGGNNDRLYAFLTSTNSLCLRVGTGTTYEDKNGVASCMVGTKYRLAIRWRDKCEIWLNGAKKAASTNNQAFNFGSLLYVAQNFAGAYQLNSYIANLHISNVARDDSWMVANGTPDQPWAEDNATTLLAINPVIINII